MASTRRLSADSLKPKAPRPARPDPAAPDTSAPSAHIALRVLLVDDGAHRISLIHRELTAAGHLVVEVVDSAMAIHDCVQRLQPDVVIVDAESPSRDTLEGLAALSQQAPRPVVVFSEDDSEAPMQHALRAGVSAYVIAGLQPQRLAPVLKVAIARFEQEHELREQLRDAQLKLSERRVIERAKGLLMDNIGLSEEAAHAHLRKMAMDRGQRLAEVAQSVVAAQALLRPPAG